MSRLNRLVALGVLALSALASGCSRSDFYHLTERFRSKAGLSERSAAQELVSSRLVWDEDLRRSFSAPPEIKTPFEASVWLFRRAAAIGRSEVARVARHQLALLVVVDDCAEAERLLEDAEGTIFFEDLEAMRSMGCRGYLEANIRWIEERYRTEGIPIPEIKRELIERATSQLQRMASGEPQEPRSREPQASEKPGE